MAFAFLNLNWSCILCTYIHTTFFAAAFFLHTFASGRFRKLSQPFSRSCSSSSFFSCSCFCSCSCVYSCFGACSSFLLFVLALALPLALALASAPAVVLTLPLAPGRVLALSAWISSPFLIALAYRIKICCYIFICKLTNVLPRQAHVSTMRKSPTSIVITLDRCSRSLLDPSARHRVCSAIVFLPPATVLHYYSVS